MTDSPQEMTACPSCGTDAPIAFSARDINRGVSDVDYHVRDCPGCGLMYVSNPPQDVGKYYTEYHAIPKTRDELLSRDLSNHRYKLDFVKPRKSSGRLLEIGPSIGYFCALAQDDGYDVHALELDPDCVTFLNDVVAITATRTTDPAQQLAAETGGYDVICMWHSLEHTLNPWDVFDAAAARLNPGGVLVVAVPNPESGQAKLMGKAWPHWDLPRHLFHIRMDWLKTRGEANGLNWEHVTTRDTGGKFFNRFSWALKASKMAPTKALEPRFWQLGTWFGRLLSPWDDQEGNGATYTAVLRRPEA